MKPSARLFIMSDIGGFFLLLDQFFKYIARQNPEATLKPVSWFGWEYFANPGIAFSLPFPNALLLILTPIIIVYLVSLLFTKKQQSLWFAFGIMLIVFGAISNYIDRLLFEVTIDYIRLFTSVINLADIMIVVGVFILLYHTKTMRTAN